jgi:hypothetical protein
MFKKQLPQIKVLRNSPRFLIKSEKQHDPIVRYSIYTHENQTWVFCNETDKTGSRAKAGTHLEIDTGLSSGVDFIFIFLGLAFIFLLGKRKL